MPIWAGRDLAFRLVLSDSTSAVIVHREDCVQPNLWLGRGLGVSSSDAEIYNALREDLIRYATALVGPDGAADVLSEVMLRVLNKRRLSDLRDPRPYLFRAILNEARDHLRRRRKHQLPKVPETVVHDAPNILPEVIEAVIQLPVRQRAATYLVYWSGYSTKETATLMDIGEGTVKRYLALARKSLKGKLYAHI